MMQRHIALSLVFLAACGSSPAMKLVELPQGANPRPPIGTSATDLWTSFQLLPPQYYHYDGARWAQVPVSGSTDFLLYSPSVCVAGPDALWVLQKDPMTSVHRLFELHADGTVEDHSSYLPAIGHPVDSHAKLVSGGGVTYLEVTDSTSTALYRLDGTAFVSLGTTAGLLDLVVASPSLILLEDNSGNFERLDGSSFVGETALPAYSLVFGYAGGGYWASLGTGTSAWEVYELAAGAWELHELDPYSGSDGLHEAYANRGLIVTGPGEASMVLAHAKQYESTAALAERISGSSLGGDTLLFQVDNQCDVPAQCAGRLGFPYQLDDGTVVLQYQEDGVSTYIAAAGDI